MTKSTEATDSALSEQESEVWRELGRLVHALPRLLEEDMLQATPLPLTEFSVLSVLNDAPGHRLRMSEIAVRTGLTPSRITRLVTALTAKSLVDKERDSNDGRGNVTVLTAAGLSCWESARTAHQASARRRFLDHLPEGSAPVLADALRAVTAQLIPDRSSTADQERA
ncbi:winged helix-turn-helix transcriptional regulator [Streptomyces sp. SID14478]|uniref:MarR family winged helix-turn-helix transcriptional regulator n=1 Tax=Streptomyces sp. SID14478 TaxID=2706073 RepID=UPI0013DC6E84|nr:MarR family winged helix-turn-helix transcriptional regulator [Streptomyces sp. SID14478]NEB76385.1 winged helix-turn-helix transcriptional regulator [Streptomyces sp. SID14478]